jgi:hypothetical protein
MELYDLLNSTGISKVQDTYDAHFLLFVIGLFVVLLLYWIFTNVRIKWG